MNAEDWAEEFRRILMKIRMDGGEVVFPEDTGPGFIFIVKNGLTSMVDTRPSL